jgi:hypothetical protein
MQRVVPCRCNCTAIGTAPCPGNRWVMLEIRAKNRSLLTHESHIHDGCPPSHMAQKSLISLLASLNDSTRRVRSTARSRKWRNRHTVSPSLEGVKMTDQVVPKGANTCSTDLALLEVELGSIAFYLQGNRLVLKLRGVGIVNPSPCHAIVEGRWMPMPIPRATYAFHLRDGLWVGMSGEHKRNSVGGKYKESHVRRRSERSLEVGVTLTYLGR